MGFCMKISFGVSVLVGLAMIVVGIVVLESALPKQLAEKLQLTEGSETADLFVKSPVPTYMSFYFFNVTNIEEVNANGSIPNLQEVGPYVYRQDKVKNVTYWGKDTINYTETTAYFFEESMTKGSLQDTINHVNIVSFAMVPLLSIMGFLPVGDYIDTHTVDEMLFSGFSTLPYFPTFDGGMTGEQLCSLLGPTCPLTFGLYMDKNNTASKEYAIVPGGDDISKLLNIVTYDKEPEVPYWNSSYCNAINGTDGKQFPPSVNEQDDLYVFNTDVCRSLKFAYEKTVNIEKISAKRFIIPDDVFADPHKHDENMCFCPQPCNAGAGVLLVSKCQGDKPVAMSCPHFYQGEKVYLDWFTGLEPKKELHQTYLDVEPVTGVVISAAKRIQVNGYLKPGEKGKVGNFNKHVKSEMFFPIFWAQEGGTIDEDNAKKLRDQVNTFYSVKWGMVAMIAIGAVALLLIIVFAFFKCAKK